MRIGATVPQTDLGADPGAQRAYAEAAEALGYTHLLAYDHVLGADPDVHRGWEGRYDIDTTFHEPLVLFGYLAAVTRLELVTGVVILPQRQTALVAKQAAEVDILTGGRFRLGVGLGWNHVEYEALGKDMSDRGSRFEEQLTLMRRLWTERSVTFRGQSEKVTGAGLAPLPVQRPIPIWFGARTLPAYRRAGRLADGWFPLVRPGPELDEARAEVVQGAQSVGRDPASIGMEGRIAVDLADPGRMARQVDKWRQVGASHLHVITMEKGLVDADAHIKAIELAASVLDLGH
jgi:probable F420-dependent oxidoreductase